MKSSYSAYASPLTNPWHSGCRQVIVQWTKLGSLSRYPLHFKQQHSQVLCGLQPLLWKGKTKHLSQVQSHDLLRHAYKSGHLASLHVFTRFYTILFLPSLADRSIQLFEPTSALHGQSVCSARVVFPINYQCLLSLCTVHVMLIIIFWTRPPFCTRSFTWVVSWPLADTYTNTGYVLQQVGGWRRLQHAGTALHITAPS